MNTAFYTQSEIQGPSVPVGYSIFMSWKLITQVVHSFRASISNIASSERKRCDSRQQASKRNRCRAIPGISLCSNLVVAMLTCARRLEVGDVMNWLKLSDAVLIDEEIYSLLSVRATRVAWTQTEPDRQILGRRKTEVEGIEVDARAVRRHGGQRYRLIDGLRERIDRR